MVNTNTFMPLRWEEVSWKEEGVLYRGCVEGDLSQRVYDTCQDTKPSYFGMYSRFPQEERFTWTRPSLDSIDYFAVHRTAERVNDVSPKIFPWNRPVHPVIIRIDARPYRDNLGISRSQGEQDGIIIRGTIDLDDIEVLYSSRVCKISPEKRRRIEEDIEREIKEQHFSQKYNRADFFQTEGFLDDFEKEPERMKAMFLSLKFTDGRGTHKFGRHELESFDRFLSSLRKLR